MPRSNDGLFSETTPIRDLGETYYHSGGPVSGHVPIITANHGIRAELSEFSYENVNRAFTGDYHVSSIIPRPTSFTISSEGQTLLSITRRGDGFEVSAPSLEAADHAGAQFVRSIRHQLLDLEVTR